MKTVLSYCLFEPIAIHPHRTWDECRLDKKRYWYNIPALLIVNEILYPNFKTRFYITPNLKNNPLFSTKPICEDNFLLCKKPVPLLSKGSPFTNKRKLATLPLSSSV